MEWVEFRSDHIYMIVHDLPCVKSSLIAYRRHHFMITTYTCRKWARCFRLGNLWKLWSASWFAEFYIEQIIKRLTIFIVHTCIILEIIIIILLFVTLGITPLLFVSVNNSCWWIAVTFFKYSTMFMIFISLYSYNSI